MTVRMINLGWCPKRQVEHPLLRPRRQFIVLTAVLVVVAQTDINIYFASLAVITTLPGTPK
jgi:hypothetical protein